ncbi:MAG: hypothetical protein H6864_05695 [Micavibrio sp.]|nr:hypothetical protein [Micavibrio sp.]
METHLAAGEVAIVYSAKLRRYGLDYRPRFGGGIQVINFCPWCGVRLPKELCDEWFDELEKLGIDDPDDGVPEEFTSELWWRKRGL